VKVWKFGLNKKYSVRLLSFYRSKLTVQFHYNGCRNKMVNTLALYLEDQGSNFSPQSGKIYEIFHVFSVPPYAGLPKIRSWLLSSPSSWTMQTKNRLTLIKIKPTGRHLTISSYFWSYNIHCSVDASCLGCDAMLLGEYLLTFQWITVPLSSRSRSFLLRMLYPKDEGTTVP